MSITGTLTGLYNFIFKRLDILNEEVHLRQLQEDKERLARYTEHISMYLGQVYNEKDLIKYGPDVMFKKDGDRLKCNDSITIIDTSVSLLFPDAPKDHKFVQDKDNPEVVDNIINPIWKSNDKDNLLDWWALNGSILGDAYQWLWYDRTFLRNEWNLRIFELPAYSVFVTRDDISGDIIMADIIKLSSDGKDLVKWTRRITPAIVELFRNDKSVDIVANPMGFVSIIHTSNIKNPLNKFEGLSDLARGINLLIKESSNRLEDLSLISQFYGNKTIHTNNLKLKSGNILRKDIVSIFETTGKDGSVNVLDTQSNLDQMINFIRLLDGKISNKSQTPDFKDLKGVTNIDEYSMLIRFTDALVKRSKKIKTYGNGLKMMNTMILDFISGKNIIEDGKVFEKIPEHLRIIENAFPSPIPVNERVETEIDVRDREVLVNESNAGVQYMSQRDFVADRFNLTDKKDIDDKIKEIEEEVEKADLFEQKVIDEANRRIEAEKLVEDEKNIIEGNQ